MDILTKGDVRQDRDTTSGASVRDPADAAARTSAFVNLAALAVGTYLGILFAKSEVAHWQRVHDMFLFREPHMYLIISVAIVVAMLAMLVIRRFEIKSVGGQPITYKPKPYHTGVIFGGTLFGGGWAITGACPGPIYAQIGAGEWMALFTLAGAMLGMFSYAALKPKLPH